MLYLFLTTLISIVLAYEKDITFHVQAGRTDCFYQRVKPNEIIDIEYQVIDATHGELDISFQMSDPVGRVIVADYKKPENAHRHTSTLEGDFRFCFDNTFSTFSEKTVFFDLMIDSEENQDKDYDEDKEMELGLSGELVIHSDLNPFVGKVRIELGYHFSHLCFGGISLPFVKSRSNAAETYMMRVSDISQSVSRVKDSVAAARRLQELLSAHEARDRNLAEDMCARVMVWSLWQILFMTVIGFTQVIFVKSLFDDTKSRSIGKLLPNFAK